MSWRCEAVSYAYPGADRPAVAGVTLAVEPGACTAVLGPNGSGKSTLLRLMLGILDPLDGGISFRDRPLSTWPRAELARRIGVVPQAEEMPFPITVRELVSMGRYPHLGPWRREGPADREAVAEAMERCDVADLAARPVSTLSGGERQRARIARALAQQPGVLALDEPTIALDIRHEMSIFELLHQLGETGVTVLLITHNLNLAARYADTLVLLDRGSVAACGAPASVVSEPLLSRVYHWPVTVTRHAGVPQVTPLGGSGRSPFSLRTPPERASTNTDPLDR